jgi:putative endonuclease
MRPIQTGKKGEALAKNWLTAQGYRILFSNWRSGRYEIDIVATKHGIVHCIEVKTTRSAAYGFPEEKISSKKHGNMKAAAEKFMEYTSVEIQLDILSIIIKSETAEYLLIENIGCGSQQ